MAGEGSVGESLERLTQERDRLNNRIDQLERLDRMTQERDRLNDRIDQLAASAIGIGHSRSAESRELGRVRRVGKGKCGHSCAEHVAVMNPTLWGTLPKEVLYLVFARLPVLDIVRLQCLSREWKLNVTGKGSEFRRTCASTKPSTRVFALFEEELMENGNYFFSLYDANANKWHYLYEPHSFLPGTDRCTVHFQSMSSSDGGLVCFNLRFYNGRTYPSGTILVGNPLTSEWKTLPPAPSKFLSLGGPGMLQLIMDRGTKSYQIIVVSEGVSATDGVVIYSSITGAWSTVNSLTCCGVFGYQYGYLQGSEGHYHGDRLGPCVFDCREGKLLELEDRFNPCEGAKSYALVRDHLFVLHERGYERARTRRDPEQRRVHRISEYEGHVDSTGLHWVKVKVHKLCPHFEKPPRSFSMKLHACEGFLLVLATNDEDEDYRQDLAWLYDMHVEKWHKISEGCTEQYFEKGIMCELEWDAVP